MDFVPQLQEILTTFVLALLALFFTVVVFYVNALRDKVKASMTEQMWALLVSQVSLIVSAAEQLGINQEIENKLNWALTQATEFAQKFGINVTPAEIRTMIEAAIMNGAANTSSDVTFTFDPDGGEPA